MTFANEAQADRAVRILSGILLVAAGSTFPSSTVGVILIAIGVVALGTGLIGWCPAYSLLGVATAERPAGTCPDCATGRRP